MPTILYQDEWVSLSLDAASGLVRFTRTALPYPDLDAVERSYAGLRGVALHVSTTAAMTLLLDVRLAPPRNDAAFEAQTNRAIEELVKRFTKMATLVRTAVGKLQTARLAHERGVERPQIFDDEESALAFLGVSAGRRDVVK